MTTQAPTQQLQMVWPQARREGPAAYAVPRGYSLRTYREGDVPAYVGLMRRAGFERWDEAKAQGVLDTMHPGGLFFVVHNETGALVATAAAQNNPRPFHPAGGEMGWVATDPEHRGKRLSYVTCAAAIRRLLQAGHPTIYLLTDDFRLPAIHVYITMGWLAFLHSPDMAGRWRVVCAALGIPYESLGTTTEPTGATSGRTT